MKGLKYTSERTESYLGGGDWVGVGVSEEAWFAKTEFHLPLDFVWGGTA